MIDNNLERVREFHSAYGVPTLPFPTIPDEDRVRLRIKLLREELGELEDALNEGDLEEVADGLCDLQYVLDGAFLEFGFGGLDMKQCLMAEVHRSNMSKLGADGMPIFREDGKILKGPNFSVPDLKKVIVEHPLCVNVPEVHAEFFPEPKPEDC